MHRSGRIESVHEVSAAVVGEGGELILSYGAPKTRAYIRSAAKPFQITPFLAEGVHTRFGVTDEEIAVCCSSHSGEEAHIETVRRLQAKCGVPESALMCGAHVPFGEDAGERFLRKNGKAMPMHNNCSGKHTAMLATALAKGEPLEGYLDPSHPVQQRIINVIKDLSEVNELQLGIDGCSAPVSYLTLIEMARMFRKLAAAENGSHLVKVREVMTGNPFMVGGTGRFDTVLMKAGGGMICSKMGAEGMQGMALRTRIGPMGVMLKVHDGSRRAAHPVAMRLLSELGVIPEGTVEELERFRRPILVNHRGIEIGWIEARD